MATTHEQQDNHDGDGNGILTPKGSTRAEFAPFSHEPGFAFLEQNDLKRLVFSAHCALCFSFLQRDFRIKPAHNHYKNEEEEEERD